MTPARPEAIFEEMYRRHAHAVYQSLLLPLRGDKKLAEDLCGSAFVEVWQNFGRYRDRAEDPDLVKLIIGIARRNAIDYWRTHQSRVEYVNPLEELPTSGVVIALPSAVTDPADEVATKDFFDRFWESLSKKDRQTMKTWLTPTEYHVAVLAWREGKTPAEVALELSLGKKSVHTHMSNARRKIRAFTESEAFKIEFGLIEMPQHLQITPTPSSTTTYGLGPLAKEH